MFVDSGVAASSVKKTLVRDFGGRDLLRRETLSIFVEGEGEEAK